MVGDGLRVAFFGSDRFSRLCLERFLAINSILAMIADTFNTN